MLLGPWVSLEKGRYLQDISGTDALESQSIGAIWTWVFLPTWLITLFGQQGVHGTMEHFCWEWEAKQGWELARSLGLEGPYILTTCCRLLTCSNMIWRDVMTCVNRRECYKAIMSILTWHHLFKCKKFRKRIMYFYIRIHFLPCNQMMNWPQSICPFKYGDALKYWNRNITLIVRRGIWKSELHSEDNMTKPDVMAFFFTIFLIPCLILIYNTFSDD